MFATAKNWIAEHKPLVAVGIVVTATIAAVAIDIALRDNSPIELDIDAE